MQSDAKLGRVSVAPEVLLTIVREAAMGTEGVARLHGSFPESIGKMLGFATAAPGISIQIMDRQLIVDLHVISQPEEAMLQLGHRLQSTVGRSIRDIVGLEVQAVNVYIEDVELPPDSDTE
jgi:uncharacterized alkaline shock family protein YloU